MELSLAYSKRDILVVSIKLTRLSIFSGSRNIMASMFSSIRLLSLSCIGLPLKRENEIRVPANIMNIKSSNALDAYALKKGWQ
jgi:hypothetical protein